MGPRLNDLPDINQDVEQSYFDPNSIDANFPMEDYREGQREAIEFAVNAFNDGKRVVILECPTGSGKSAIGMTIAEMVKRSYYITITKILQDQLVRDFDQSIVELKGRNAYPCTFYQREGTKMVDRQIWTPEQLERERQEHPDCGVGFCRTQWNSANSSFYCDFCFPQENSIDGHRTGRLRTLPPGMRYSACPYYEQVYSARVARKVVMNFSSFLYQTMMTKRFARPRDLMILDECHNVEPQLLSFVSFSITDSHLQRKGIFIPELNTPYEYYCWFLEADVLGSIDDAIKDAVKRDDPKLVDELTRLLFKYNLFVKHVQEDETGVEWVSEYSEKRGKGGGVNHRSATIKPVFVRSFANKLLFKYASRILMMSATVLDVDIICQSLGLDRSQVAAKRVRNRFPKANRPIYIQTVAKMTGGKRTMPKWAPPLMRGVEDIANKHAGEKGIIHTHNFAIMEYILEHCSRKLETRLLNQWDFRNKFEMLHAHSKSDDSILIAPAMHEGIDLSGPLCYDDETDVLTKDGWRRISSIRNNDLVAMFDTFNCSISFGVPTRVIHSHATKWVETGGPMNNLLVTDSHRMLWYDRGIDYLREETANWQPPSDAYRFVSSGIYRGEGSDLADDEIRLIVALQSTGFSVPSAGDHISFAPHHPMKIAHLHMILQRLNIPRDNEMRDGAPVFRLPWDRIKHLTEFVQMNNDTAWDMNALLRLSSSQRRLLIHELGFWNNKSRWPPRRSGTVVYYPRLLEDLGTIQAVAALSGHGTNRDTDHLTCHAGLYSDLRDDNQDFVFRRDESHRPCHCLEVSTGWLVVRRRGKVSISGNSRFQVICKVPFPNCFDDKQLARRVEIDRRYYTWLVTLKLIQSYGRSVRSETDYAATYILDESIHRFLADARKMLPQWFREAIIDRSDTHSG